MTKISIFSFDFLAPHDHNGSRASFLNVLAATMMILSSIVGLLTMMIILFESIKGLLIVRAGVCRAAAGELQVRGGSQPGK